VAGADHEIKTLSTTSKTQETEGLVTSHMPSEAIPIESPLAPAPNKQDDVQGSKEAAELEGAGETAVTEFKDATALHTAAEAGEHVVTISNELTASESDSPATVLLEQREPEAFDQKRSVPATTTQTAKCEEASDVTAKQEELERTSRESEVLSTSTKLPEDPDNLEPYRMYEPFYYFPIPIWLR